MRSLLFGLLCLLAACTEKNPDLADNTLQVKIDGQWQEARLYTSGMRIATLLTVTGNWRVNDFIKITVPNYTGTGRYSTVQGSAIPEAMVILTTGRNPNEVFVSDDPNGWVAVDDTAGNVFTGRFACLVRNNNGETRNLTEGSFRVRMQR